MGQERANHDCGNQSGRTQIQLPPQHHRGDPDRAAASRENANRLPGGGRRAGIQHRARQETEHGEGKKRCSRLHRAAHLCHRPQIGEGEHPACDRPQPSVSGDPGGLGHEKQCEKHNPGDCRSPRIGAPKRSHHGSHAGQHCSVKQPIALAARRPLRRAHSEPHTHSPSRGQAQRNNSAAQPPGRHERGHHREPASRHGSGEERPQARLDPRLHRGPRHAHQHPRDRREKQYYSTGATGRGSAAGGSATGIPCAPSCRRRAKRRLSAERKRSAAK